MKKSSYISMSKNVFTFLIFIIVIQAQTLVAQNVGINATGASPDSSACLDVSSTNKGILVPRLALTSVNSASPVTSPENSLLVYNTATAGTSPNNVSPGYYFWKDSIWIKMSAGNTSKTIINDLRVVIDKGTNSAQLGSLNGISGPQIWFFRDGSGVEAMSFTLQLPHDWKEGSTVYPHIHWTPKTSGSGNVQWNLDYSWADLDETTPATFPAITTSSVVVNGPFTANKHLISPLTTNNVGIDGTGKHYSSVLICRIWRDSSLASDTYTNDAGGLSIDFHVKLIDPFSE
ncbi:MAG: hypothetical protein Q8M29_12225 [Bacteroidota bacterium]|nr:hypothetical protein [Bacteroidota bacterium]